ncbi:hypothetical protein RISK_004219 [Rhodopirellula islandica]|uniref:Uncharacterized protein n=1 Tax=Rhodopirellula islandica TaxID=595434 RepID=A0A0J1BAW1_RHOIS|nr:hypothetical protein RISK_004219 [Rhodopirellula islandica]
MRTHRSGNTRAEVALIIRTGIQRNSQAKLDFAPTPISPKKIT